MGLCRRRRRSRAVDGEAAVLQPGVDRADRVGFTRVQKRAAGPIAQDSRHLVQEPRRRERVGTIVVRSIASATCSSNAGSLHAPRHATMHMCALSDTTLGPKSCATSVGHASRATHGENVRIDLAVALGAQRRGGEARLGVDRRVRIREGAREGRGARVEEADDGGGVEEAAGGEGGRGFRRLPPRRRARRRRDSSPRGCQPRWARRAMPRGRALESRDRPADRPGVLPAPVSASAGRPFASRGRGRLRYGRTRPGQAGNGGGRRARLARQSSKIARTSGGRGRAYRAWRGAGPVPRRRGHRNRAPRPSRASPTPPRRPCRREEAVTPIEER